VSGGTSHPVGENLRRLWLAVRMSFVARPSLMQGRHRELHEILVQQVPMAIQPMHNDYN
jgi:hypothetical protein